MPGAIMVNVGKAQECLTEMGSLKSKKAPVPRYDFEKGRAPESFCELANDISSLDAELTALIGKTQDFLSRAIEQYEAQDANMANLIGAKAGE